MTAGYTIEPILRTDKLSTKNKKGAFIPDDRSLLKTQLVVYLITSLITPF